MQIVDRGIVFDATKAPRETRFCTFLSLERLQSGAFLCGFRVGSAKESPDEDVRILRSADEGKTWQVVCEGFGTVPPGGGRLRAVALTEVEPGRVLGSFMWVDRSDPSLPFANPQTQGILPSKVLVAESRDEGRTWSDFRQVPLGDKGAITGEILRLHNGTLALPYETWKGYYDTSPGEHHAALHLSNDGGQTWTGPVIVAHDDDGRLLFWDQRLCVHPDDGRLIALFWTHDRQAQQDVAMYMAWGSLDGQTWSEPLTTNIAGQIAAPLGLPGGRVFAAYVHRHDPPSLRAILSNDYGRTWMAADELVFYEKEPTAGKESGMGGARDFGAYWDDMARWTFGHPAVRQLANGDLLVVHYAGDASAMSACWVRMAL